MNKYIITFGSAHLPNFNVNPNKVMLVLEDEDEFMAREQLMNTSIRNVFAFSYTYDDHVDEFKRKWGMVEYTLEELLELEDVDS